MKFNFFGNEKIVHYFERLLEKGEFPPAFLFCGRDGLGKFYLAKSIAKAINCLENKGSGLFFCGECKNCKRIEDESFLDLTVVRPEGNFIKIDQIREVVKKCSLSPFESEKRIIIIDSAEKMNRESANSLLKTLEEPPEDVIFFLITSKLSGIIPTIRSRCQIFEFLPLKNEELARFLSTKKNIPYEDALSYALFLDGSPGKIVDFDRKEIHSFQNKTLTFLEICLDNNYPLYSIRGIIESVCVKEEVFDKFLKFFFYLLRDILVVKTRLSNVGLYYLNELERVVFFAERLNFERLFEISFKLFDYEENRDLNLKRDLFLWNLFFFIKSERDVEGYE